MQAAVINPYDLHARSDAVAAALLLAPSVVTLRPAPLEGSSAAQLHTAAADTPAFAELVRAWAWSGPLWRAGVLRSDWRGDEPLPDIQQAAREIAVGGGPLADVVGASPFEDTHAYLQAVCRDILRGGRDPGVAVPVASGIEAFAGRHGLAIFRGQATSIAAKFEARTARTEAQVTTTVAAGLDAQEMLALREEAGSPLAILWQALGSGGGPDLAEAGDALTEAVRGWVGHVGGPARATEVRLTLARAEAGSVRASAMSALGASPVIPAAGTSELARPGTRVVRVRTLPWSAPPR